MFIQSFLGTDPESATRQRTNLVNVMQAFRELREMYGLAHPRLGGLPIETVYGLDQWWPMKEEGGWWNIKHIRDTPPEWTGTLLAVESPYPFEPHEMGLAFAKKRMDRFWDTQDLEPVPGQERYFELLEAMVGELPAKLGRPQYTGIFTTAQGTYWLGWFPHPGDNPAWALVYSIAQQNVKDKMKGKFQ